MGVQVSPNQGALWSFNSQAVGEGTSILWQLEGDPPPPNPVPTLASLSPSSAEYGGPEFVLTVTGSNFVPTSRVRWRGSDRLTTYISDTELRAVIPANDLTFSSSPQVAVFNPAPGGGLSNQFVFTISNPVPTISLLSPDSARGGGLSFRLTVEGSGFVPFSQVQWNGVPRDTVFYSTQRVVGLIPATDIATPGAVDVTVVNGPPGGGTSNALTFVVTSPPNPVPVLSSLSPSSIEAGGLDFTLTVNGSGFVSNSVVRWDGADRATSFVSESQLTATILTSDIAGPATAAVTVFTPAPGGGTSNTLTFTVTRPTNARFKGKVRDKNLNPIAGATVTAFQGGVAQFSTTTGSDGKYVLDVEAGTYDLVTFKEGYFDKTKLAQSVAVNQTKKRVNFKLRQHSFFQGTVTDGNTGAPLEGALVEARKKGVVRHSTTTGTDGSYRLLVVSKTYTLRASKPGYQSQRKKEQQVSEGGTEIVNFSLTPATATLVPQSFQTSQALTRALSTQDLPEEGQEPDSGVKVPPRFLGWNHARRQGLEYLRHFSRPRGQPALPVQNPAFPPQLPSPSVLPRSQQAAGATSEFPALQLREALPAGFIPTGVATGDFNGDGRADWVVSNGGDNNLWLYLGRGDGTAELPIILPLEGRSPVWVTAADLRGIGILDLIVAEVDSGTVGVLFGIGDGTFAREKRYFVPAPPIFLLADDFNGDGRTDVLAGLLGTLNSGPVALLPGDGTGGFREPVFTSADFLITAFWMDAADLNGDGSTDLVITNPDPSFLGGGVRAYVNNGDGTFKLAQVVMRSVPIPGVPLGGRIVFSTELGDVNEDGCVDAVVRDSFGLANVFLGHCGGSFQTVPEMRSFGLGDTGFGIALDDVNGDGHLDIITSGAFFNISILFGRVGGDLLSVLLGDGRGSFSPARLYRGDLTMFTLALADFTQDGYLDVVTANQDSDSATVYLNDGQGGFGEPAGRYFGYFAAGEREGVTNSPISGFLPADVDGDGKLDLAVVERGRLHPEPYQMTVLFNDGTGKFSDPIRSPVLEAFRRTFVDFILADFRHTGHPDFLGIVDLIDGALTSSLRPILAWGLSIPPPNWSMILEITGS